MAGGRPGTPDLQYKDYYAVLGVPKTASQTEIKKAFRKLARQHHPDAKPGDKLSEQRFKEANEANEVLSTPDKRKKYDALGADWQAYERSGAGAPGGGRGGSGDPFGPGGPFAGYARSDARSDARSGGSGQTRYEFRTSGSGGEGFSDFFEMFFGADGPARSPSRTARSAAPAPRSIHEATAEISLDEAYHGTTRLVEVDGKRLEITIPAGADTGTRVRLSGRGPGGGDLVVVVKQMPDARFVRRGADLDRDLPLTLEEALLGAEVHVETLKGRVSLKIPAGTQSGRTFRLTGRGMPRFKSPGHGDLFVKAKVVLPAALSDEAVGAATALFRLVDQPSPR